MANENDELLPHKRNDSKTQNNNSSSSSRLATTETGAADIACTAAAAAAADGQTEKTTTAKSIAENSEVNACSSNNHNREETTGPSCNENHDSMVEQNEATGAKGKLNDLVADLYISSMSNGPTAQMSSGNSSYSSYGDYKNIRATAGPGSFSDSPATVTSVSAAPTLPTQNTFSFKHFLSSGASSLQAPSSTVTSLDLPATCTGQTSTVPTTSVTSSCVFQSSTGARPKVPQSNSSTLAGSQNAVGSSTCDTMGSGTKMKRSPRFSSFDSQASLAGATAHAEDEPTAASSASFSGGFRLHPESERVDIFSSQRMQAGNVSNNASSSSSDYDRRFVPRSYSHYDMQMPASVASPRRRMETIDARPNRLSLAPSSKQRVRLEAHCFPGELPAEAAANRSSAADFPAAAAAAALPDFVQDHWLDSFYASEMHLNSPPNSPVCDFADDFVGGVVGGGSAVGASAASGNGGGSGAVSSLDVANPLVDDTEPPTQRLPDFLSDGPIIHSSQRLADVAAGLPSNTMSSPEEVALKQQLSALRIENERQRRELSEARLALTEQTRRANELERQLLEAQRNDAVYNRSTVEQAEENLEQSKRRHNVTLAVVRKLKQQVKQLTSDIDCLRRENEVLRDESAVGGCSSSSNSANCDRPYMSGAGAAAYAAAASVSDNVGVGAAGNTIRPSRSQQISRDLLRAASNAEHNLRQLLTGVDNLRQMAADIEQAERVEYDVSPDLFSDFLDECDDYEEYPGGPAL